MGIFSGFKKVGAQIRTMSTANAILAPHIKQYFDLPRFKGYEKSWQDKADFNAKVAAIIESDPTLARGDKNPLFSWEDTVRRPHPYQEAVTTIR